MDTANPFACLSPDTVLSAAETALGRAFDPVVTPCNSYVNRVYSLRDEEGERFVVKFYRPGRWGKEAVAEEHAFLAECAAAELPVVAPLPLKEGVARAGSGPIDTTDTIGERDGILFACFPFRSGRTFDVTGDDDYLRLGSLIGRLHAVSRLARADSRVTFHPIDLTLAFCRAFADSDSLHPDMRGEFLDLCFGVLETASARFDRSSFIRIHGDCHRGNILDRLDEGLLLIDFDDMMTGPAVQDLWLLLPDHLESARREMGLLVEGYERFGSFDRRSLDLVETLRFMRILYFLSWREAQKDDSLFAERNPDWGTKAFWIREMEDLRYQARHALASLAED